MAVLNNWNGLRHELNDIGELDETCAFQPQVLREWFSVVLNCTDNTIRRKVEKALLKLSKRPESVEIVANIIRSDLDVNIRVFGATYLANNAANFVDAILETPASEEKLLTIREILGFCLKEDEMPQNVRLVLLKGFGSFMFKVIPDVWSNSIAEVVHSNGNPCFVLQLLADLGRNVSELPQVYSHKRQRNQYLITALSETIFPYLYQLLESTTEHIIYEKVAEVVRYFWALNDADPQATWPIVTKIFESQNFTFQTITSLTCGIRVFNAKQYPRYISQYCDYLIKYVNTPLGEAIERSIKMVIHDDQSEHDQQMVELTAELCDFYGLTLSAISGFAFCRRSEAEPFPMVDEVSRAIFNFITSLSKVPGKAGIQDPFSEMTGMFFNRLYESLTDLVYNMDPRRKNELCQAIEGSLEAVFVKSRIEPSDFGENIEAIQRFRDSAQDLILLLDLLSEHGIIPAFITALNLLLANKEGDQHVRMSSITVFYYYLNCLPEIPLETLTPHFETVKSTLEEICASEATDKEKEECVYHFFNFLSNLLDKDDRFSDLVGAMFILVVPYLTEFCQYPMSLISSLRLIHAYSRYCIMDEGIVTHLSGFIVGFATNPDPEIQRLVMTSLINFLSCGASENGSSFSICCFVLEFVEQKCENCLSICQYSSMDPLTLKTFRSQSQLISYIGEDANKHALEVVSPLVTILCDYLVRLMECRVPEMDLMSFANPVCKMVIANVIRRIASVQVDYAWNYPDVYVKIYKEGLSLEKEFVLEELIPMISNLITALFANSGTSQLVSGADLSILELICFFFKKHHVTFLEYISMKSSLHSIKDFLTACIGVALKTITFSFSDEGISKGLRAVETIINIGQMDVLDSLNDVYPIIIPPVFDLIFSLFFHAGQSLVAQILVFCAKRSPEAFSQYVTRHKQMEHNDEVKFILGTPNRTLFLKYFLRWNSTWSRKKE